MPLTLGSRLGSYEIVAPLGAGGMGEVYRAHDTRLKREVALKVLPPSFSADPDRLRRFELEAEVYITTETDIPLSIRRFDLKTGRTELVRMLQPADMTGVNTIAPPLVTRDGRTYAYSYMRLLGDLYVADGFK